MCSWWSLARGRWQWPGSEAGQCSGMEGGGLGVSHLASHFPSREKVIYIPYLQYLMGGKYLFIAGMNKMCEGLSENDLTCGREFLWKVLKGEGMLVRWGQVFELQDVLSIYILP